MVDGFYLLAVLGQNVVELILPDRGRRRDGTGGAVSGNVRQVGVERELLDVGTAGGGKGGLLGGGSDVGRLDVHNAGGTVGGNVGSRNGRFHDAGGVVHRGRGLLGYRGRLGLGLGFGGGRHGYGLRRRGRDGRLDVVRFKFGNVSAEGSGGRSRLLWLGGRNRLLGLGGVGFRLLHAAQDHARGKGQFLLRGGRVGLRLEIGGPHGDGLGGSLGLLSGGGRRGTHAHDLLSGQYRRTARSAAATPAEILRPGKLGLKAGVCLLGGRYRLIKIEIQGLILFFRPLLQCKHSS